MNGVGYITCWVQNCLYLSIHRPNLFYSLSTCWRLQSGNQKLVNILIIGQRTSKYIYYLFHGNSLGYAGATRRYSTKTKRNYSEGKRICYDTTKYCMCFAGILIFFDRNRTLNILIAFYTDAMIVLECPLRKEMGR